jgi:signal transduction histidine kinase
LALSYDIRLAQASAQATEDIATAQTLARAVEQTHAALEELRQLARGIYPAVLTDAGLLRALASFADTAPVLVEILGADDRRYSAAIETAAYFAVVEAVDDAAQRHADHAALTVTHADRCLTLTLADNGSRRTSPMIALADRVGALGGTLHLEPTSCRVEMPCG